MRQFSVSASNVINRVSIKSLGEKQIVKTVECSFFSISAIPVKTVTDRVVGSTVMTSYQLKYLPWGKCPIESVAMSKQCLCEPGLTWEVGSAGSDVILGRGELRPHLTVITLSHVPPHHTPHLTVISLSHVPPHHFCITEPRPSWDHLSFKPASFSSMLAFNSGKNANL